MPVPIGIIIDNSFERLRHNIEDQQEQPRQKFYKTFSNSYNPSGIHKSFRQLRKALRKSQKLSGNQKSHMEITIPFRKSKKPQGNRNSFREIKKAAGKSQFPQGIQKSFREFAIPSGKSGKFVQQGDNQLTDGLQFETLDNKFATLDLKLPT